ncbi:MAG: carbonic anhydrase family protein [Magnetococcales bacterium]|nr:carbonic anhydrase family protein [Magnetococcales bacterium]
MGNKSNGILQAVVLSCLLSGVAGFAIADDHGASGKPGGGDHGVGSTAHWGYEGETGPSRWGEMGFATCSTGKNQSPIDLMNASDSILDPLQFSYQAASVSVVNNGHTIQFNLPAGNSMTVGGKKFTLLQFHFHSGSEHTVQGKSYPMELHLVHKADDGELAVVGVLLAEGAANGEGGAVNPTLQTVFDNLPEKSGQTQSVDAQIMPAALLPLGQSYFHYKGSLTTPPCTEGVNWFVMREPVGVEKSQLLKFTSIYANNARPPQPQNSRNLLSRSSESSDGKR